MHVEYDRCFITQTGVRVPYMEFLVIWDNAGRGTAKSYLSGGQPNEVPMYPSKCNCIDMLI